MPFTGGFSPSPERYGGGENNTRIPLLQRVFESLVSQRGSAYDQTVTSAVGIEQLAYARSLTFDGHLGNQRLWNQFIPSKMTADGLLPRWEAIFGTPPLPGDTEVVRRGRIAAAWARMGASNATQAVTDQISSIMGPLYNSVTYFAPPPGNALSWWPGNSGSAAKVSTVAGNLATVVGLANIPTAAYGMLLTLSNCFFAVNNGTFLIRAVTPTTSVGIINGAALMDNGIGGTSGSPTIKWSLTNPARQWMSTVSHVDIQSNLPAGFFSLNGAGQKVPNAAWYTVVSTLNATLDSIMPAWATWTVFVLNSAGVMAFKLDEPDLDLEVLGS